MYLQRADCGRKSKSARRIVGQAPKFTGALAAGSGFWHWLWLWLWLWLWHWHWHWHWHHIGTGTLPHTTCHFALYNPSFSSRRIQAQLKRAMRRGMRGLRAAGQWGWQPAARLFSWSAVAVVAPLVGTPFLSLTHSLTHSLALALPLLLVPSRSPLGASIIAWCRSSHQSGKVGQGGLPQLGLSRFGCLRICAQMNNDITSSNYGLRGLSDAAAAMVSHLRIRAASQALATPWSKPTLFPRVPTLRVCHHPALICCHVRLPLVATSSRPLSHLLWCCSLCFSRLCPKGCACMTQERRRTCQKARGVASSFVFQPPDGQPSGDPRCREHFPDPFAMPASELRRHGTARDLCVNIPRSEPCRQQGACECDPRPRCRRLTRYHGMKAALDLRASAMGFPPS